MSRFGPRQPDSLPKTAAEYRAWFEKEVIRVKDIPISVYLKSRPPVVSAWQREGARLVLEERARLEELGDWGI